MRGDTVYGVTNLCYGVIFIFTVPLLQKLLVKHRYYDVDHLIYKESLYNNNP